MIETTRLLPLGGDLPTFGFSDLYLDGTLTENYDVSAMISAHPIESSADISDHTRPELRRFQLECVVSENPYDPLIIALGGSNRVNSVFDTLDFLIRNGIDVDVETDRGLFESFLIESRSEQRDSSTGDGSRFTLTFQKLEIAELAEVEAPSPRVERARRRQDRGRQSPENTDIAQTVSAAITEQTSVLLDSLRGAYNSYRGR
jgi:hypothetical protein